MASFMPSAKLVLILRDPATIIRSRFNHCVAREEHGGLSICGGSNDEDFECMLVQSGLINASLRCKIGHGLYRDEVNLQAAIPTANTCTSKQVLAARMAPNSWHLVEDYLEIINRWANAYFGSYGLVLFTENLSNDPKQVMNKILRFIGYKDYSWPYAEKNMVGKWTYSESKSKYSIHHKMRKLRPEWQLAIRKAMTPLIKEFKNHLPCLGAPWMEARPDILCDSEEIISSPSKYKKAREWVCAPALEQGLK